MRRKLIVVLLSTAMCLLVVTSALAVTYNEAPMLRTKVAAGELPPVEERLPKDPVVLNQEWNELPEDVLKMEVGQYGGTLRTVHPNPGWNPDIWVAGREPLLRSPGFSTDGIRGNVLKDYEVSADKKVFTFFMREGLKWSDGMPVTSEDVLFAYEDFLLNEKLTPVFPSWLTREGKPMQLEVIDEYTFRISFAEPYGNFLVQMSIGEWVGYEDLLKPKHYLKQFHTRYTPLEELEPLIKKEALSKGEWWTLFGQKDTGGNYTSPASIGFPRLTPWVMVKAVTSGETYERNPYYFKVDAEGNQLPYIDNIKDDLVADVKISTLKVLAGEVDFLCEDASMADAALYKENEQKGGYRTLLLVSTDPLAVLLNLTHTDPVWREVVRDVRFRKALSLGMNRADIIEAVYLGFAESPTTLPGAYDPAQANQLLDEMGMDKRDKDGWRLGPDGNTFVIPFDQAAAMADWMPAAELVVESFKALGIKTTMKPLSYGLMSEIREANELKATIVDTGEPLWRENKYSGWDLIRYWAYLWLQWGNSNGEKGEEPPEEVKRLINLFSESKGVSPGTPESKKLWDELYSLMSDNVWFLAVTQETKIPVIVSVKLNFTDIDTDFAMLPEYALEQMFFRQ